jgi:hypothetical protein
VGIAFVGVVAWMRSIASYTPTPRFLERDRRSHTGRAPEPVQEPDPVDPAPEFDGLKGGPRR